MMARLQKRRPDICLGCLLRHAMRMSVFMQREAATGRCSCRKGSARDQVPLADYLRTTDATTFSSCQSVSCTYLHFSHSMVPSVR